MTHIVQRHMKWKLLGVSRLFLSSRESAATSENLTWASGMSVRGDTHPGKQGSTWGTGTANVQQNGSVSLGVFLAW